MSIFFIIGILFGAIVVFFALQNTAIVTVAFFSWQFTGSLAFVLLVTLLSGMVVASFFWLSQFIRDYFKFKNLQKEKNNLAEELRKQKELTISAKKPTESKEEAPS